MKAYSIALPILAATVLLTGGAGIAVAQETGPFTIECREATKDLDEAVKADENWEKAKEQNRAYREAREDVAQALKGNGIASALKSQAAGDVTVGEVDKEIADLNRNTTNTPAENERLLRKHNDLRALVVKMESKFNKANDDNERALERKAKEQDADKLRDEANKACGVVTTTPQTPAPPAPPVTDFDCADFATQEAAQAVFEANGRPARLDFDGDGNACEKGVDDVNLDTNGDGSNQVSVVPARVDSGLAL